MFPRSSRFRVSALFCTASIASMAVGIMLTLGSIGVSQQPSDSVDLDVRYAEIHLKLAELDFERAKAWNDEVPGLFSERTLDFLRKHVEIDEEQLEQARNGVKPNPHDLYIRTAEAALELAENDVERRQEIFDQYRTRHHSLDLQRAKVLEEASKMNLQRAVKQSGAVDTIGYLQWQLEEQRNQILELHIKVEAASRR